MHTEPITERDEFTQAHYEYFNGIDRILTDPEKQQRFRQLTPFPLPTNSLCDSIYQEYPRALKAHNKYIKNTFRTEELEVDFKQYLEHIGFKDFWDTEAMDAMKKYINAFIVVDLPRVQTGGRPEPYMYLLHVHYVIDAEVRKDKPVAEYIAFCQDITQADKAADIIHRAMVIDDVHYRMFFKKKDNDAVWQLDYEQPHGLGECPAYKFYPTTISQKNRLNSLSPITTSLGNLDDYLTGKVSVKYYESYGMFPIYWGYKQKCTYIDQKTGGQCNGQGQVVFMDIAGLDRKPVITACPKCSTRKMMGPGTFIEVEPPQMKEEADMREPVGFVGVDVDALNFAEEKLKSLRNEIVYDTTGKSSIETQSKEALNEMDVKRQFESRLNVLLEIKKNLEVSMYYAFTNLAKLRYADQYVNTVVDLGTEFFLRSEEALNKDYSDTKAAGRPSYELAAKREFIYLTAYHNNPDELARLNILQNIEPYQDYSLAEIKNMGIQMVDPVGYLLKLNLYSYIKRFERENLPILQFGNALSFDKKIQTISNTLKTYVDEQLSKADPEGGPFTPKVSGEQKRPGAGGKPGV